MSSEEEKIEKPKTKLEKAREAIGDLSTALKKQADDRGWDIEISEEVDKFDPPTPKVKLMRKCLVRDSITAEGIAKQHFNPGDKIEDFELTPQQIMLAKLSLLCTFDDKVWSIIEIQELGEDFFTNVTVQFAKYLGM